MVRYSIRGKGAIQQGAKELCEQVLADLEKAKRPVLKATKCSLDNAIYSPSAGYLTPGTKKVRTELNVSSVKKLSRSVFMLEILLRNIRSGGVNTKRELYYVCKGLFRFRKFFYGIKYKEFIYNKFST